MPVVIVVGAQWGDEGKGMAVDYLVADLISSGKKKVAVTRGQGGNNAGHTVKRQGCEEFRLNFIPSGILHPEVRCFLGPGMVIAPEAFLSERQGLEGRGVNTDNLFISDKANLIMPYHIDQEKIMEKIFKIGSTGRGIAPAYSDEYARAGLRFGDLFHPDWLKQRLESIAEVKTRTLTGLSGKDYIVRADQLFEQCSQWAEKLKGRVVDSVILLDEILKDNGTVIVEGQLGMMRDINHGIYPYVTSSAPCVGGLIQGAGIDPTSVEEIIGIVKAYSTCVGGGPMVTEDKGEIGDKLRAGGRDGGKEFGTATGRPRRCGWLDLPVLRRSKMLNGFTSAVITKVDVLDQFEEIGVCVAYDVNGKIFEVAPDTYLQQNSEPIIEYMPGWLSPTSDIRQWIKLPGNTRNYINRIVQELDAEIKYISVGPSREATIKV